ncbi:aminotransferase class I/II-fold pyridoxal phosphate-dependent enzyme [Turicibacter sanguinis]|uniref:DegT/DnrJ/EryC1/StrS family aminotransferase n=1 Tax=Turicibacter sanguinis TaxID=154288 RepID=UPI001E286202|nr:aminotransferase class I/II-fold pyridoxal phosphate-dependent enzyme [Turicibacter sanguinis]MDB8564136.1 aminotransferase class I/II-fold pyridoxal phosphate-dependent enzyme [Turicibacter sanguinis]
MERIYLASPHMSDEGYEQAYVKEAFESNWVAPLGPNVTNFEKELAEYVDVKSASALSSGTAAIHLGLKALGVTQGDIVFCSTLTFSASCNPIIYCGAEPVFIDSNEETWNMCPKALELAFEDAVKNNKLPKAVVVVNLYGQSADMDPIVELCKHYNVPILEDAAESLGATYKGRMSGTIGDIGIYSFNGNKIITTSGGGMMVSNNEEYTKKATFWATQSREQERHYEHKEIGYNYRMSNIVAGIGRGQLKVLNDRIAKKKEIYETYKEAFKDIEDIQMMNICDFGESNYWLSVMTLKETSKVKPIDIMLALEKENIESRPVWKPMHMQPVFNQYKFFTVGEEISVSEDLFNRGVCLPSDTKMTKEQLLYVIKLIKELFN